MSIRTYAKVSKGKPCPTCPWRPSAVGKVTSEQVEQLVVIQHEPGLTQGCHSKTTRVCAGFLVSIARNDANLAFPLALGKVNIFRDVCSDEPLFKTWGEMLTAHGVDKRA